MASTIGHEKPEGVDEPPAVKKVRLDVDAKVEAKVAEDVKKVKIDEDVASSTDSPAPADAAGFEENADANGNAEAAATGEDEAAAASASEEKEEQMAKPDVTGSAFGGFAAFSGSSGFGAFASASTSSSGFGAFASASTSSSGFGVSASTSTGFATALSTSASTSASTSPVPSSTGESKPVDESSEPDKEAAKPSGFGGFAAFQNTSTFSSVASSTTATDGFGSTATTQSDLSEIDAAAAAEKKSEVVVPALTEAELANGEEGETILVEKRAKLYKLVDGDYAEVGIGPLRVLRALDADPTDKAAARFVMRRESYARGPGTKLLVNAALASCLACVKKTEKQLLMTVLEPVAGQEQEFAPSTFLLRFGAPEDLDAVHARLARYLPAAK